MLASKLVTLQVTSEHCWLISVTSTTSGVFPTDLFVRVPFVPMEPSFKRQPLSKRQPLVQTTAIVQTTTPCSNYSHCPNDNPLFKRQPLSKRQPLFKRQPLSKRQRVSRLQPCPNDKTVRWRSARKARQVFTVRPTFPLTHSRGDFKPVLDIRTVLMNIVRE